MNLEQLQLQIKQAIQNSLITLGYFDESIEIRGEVNFPKELNILSNESWVSGVVSKNKTDKIEKNERVRIILWKYTILYSLLMW